MDKYYIIVNSVGYELQITLLNPFESHLGGFYPFYL